jgi:predicted transcriptional regulator
MMTGRVKGLTEQEFRIAIGTAREQEPLARHYLAHQGEIARLLKEKRWEEFFILAEYAAKDVPTDLAHTDQALYRLLREQITEYRIRVWHILDTEKLRELIAEPDAIEAGIEKGERAIREGKVVSHGEAKRQMRKWLGEDPTLIKVSRIDKGWVADFQPIIGASAEGRTIKDAVAAVKRRMIATVRKSGWERER